MAFGFVIRAFVLEDWGVLFNLPESQKGSIHGAGGPAGAIARSSSSLSEYKDLRPVRNMSAQAQTPMAECNDVKHWKRSPTCAEEKGIPLNYFSATCRREC